MADVTLTIDGKLVLVPEDMTIHAAAALVGIDIPVLCFYEHIKPLGTCQICVVEAEQDGKARLMASCAARVKDGMIIRTETDAVIAKRKEVITKLMGMASNIDLLWDLAAKYGMDMKAVQRGNTGCILCGRCVRVCKDLVGANALRFDGKGDARVLVPNSTDGGPAPTCIACGACSAVCPTGWIQIEDIKGRVIVHEELALGPNRAIQVPSLQAVPNTPFIDPSACIHFKTGKCGVCQTTCPTQAIRFEQTETIRELDVGNIILATGMKQMDTQAMMQFGYSRYDNVLTALEFERLNCAAGPTGGKIQMTNGNEPKSVAIIHCVGSRDENYHEYCSRVCCMYGLKFAHLIKEKTDAEVYQLYIDLRCFGKGYEEFYKRLLNEDVRFIRGKAAEVTDFALTPDEMGKLVVRVEDTLVGKVRRIPVDMVVLSAALEPAASAAEMGRLFGVSRGKDGWFIEKHPKLGPISTATDGVFLAGFCQSPKDIPDTVNQATGAAGEVLSVIARGRVEIESATAEIDSDLCTGCKICNDICPFGAISFIEEKNISEVNPALCKGCGTCVAACPSSAIKGQHFSDPQIFAEMDGIFADLTVD